LNRWQRDFLTWWLDYPQWAAIGMVAGAGIGLLCTAIFN